MSERERCAAIADLVAASVRKGAGIAHGADGQKLIAQTAEWIAEAIRNQDKH